MLQGYIAIPIAMKNSNSISNQLYTVKHNIFIRVCADKLATYSCLNASTSNYDLVNLIIGVDKLK